MLPGVRRLSLVLLATITLAACGREPPPPVQNEQQAIPGLKQRLAQVDGRYAFRDDLGALFYSEKLKLEEFVSSEPPEKALAELVDCLDDATPSRSTLDGKPVATGVVCYEALTQLVYHEPTSPTGDVAATWPGSVTPRASPEQMRAAKEAWKKVVASKTYVFQ